MSFSDGSHSVSNRPAKSVRNRYVIKRFGDAFVLLSGSHDWWGHVTHNVLFILQCLGLFIQWRDTRAV